VVSRCVGAALMAKLDVVRPNDFPALKRLLWCGEVFYTPALRYWMRQLPHAAFTNLYGPTEATIASSHYTVPRCPDDDRAEIPIGERAEGRNSWSWTTRSRPCRREVGSSTSRAGLSPGTGAIRTRPGRRSCSITAGRPQASGSTRPAILRGLARTAWCTSSVAPTPRSKPAAIGSNSARSRRR